MTQYKTIMFRWCLLPQKNRAMKDKVLMLQYIVTLPEILGSGHQTCSQVLTVRVQVQVLASQVQVQVQVLASQVQVQVQVLNLRVQVRDSMSQPVFLVISKNFQL